jgi:perosamine synthetase
VIPHNSPTLGVAENAAVTRVLDSQWIAQGREVEALENELCDYLGVSGGHAVMVSSGTSALYLALFVLNARGKKVGLPVYVCSAVRNAIGMVGAECAYLDCAPDSPNLDSAAVPESGADILVAPSMYGIPAKLPADGNVAVVEDIAQALGSKVGADYAGLRGSIGVCSFYATKLMTTGGQGGALISKDSSIIDQVRDYREFDSRRDQKLRFNFQMTDLQASIGRAQLARMPKFLRLRENIFEIYKNAGLPMLEAKDSNVSAVRYRAVMRCSEPEALITTLAAQGIRAIVPIEEWELLDASEVHHNAKALTRSTVSLPIYPSLSEQDAKRIAQVARAFA